MITSTTRSVKREQTQLLITMTTDEGRQSGLLHDSAIKCENLFTVEKRVILRTIGNLPQKTM